LFIYLFLPGAHYRRLLPCRYAVDTSRSAWSSLYKTSAFTL